MIVLLYDILGVIIFIIYNIYTMVQTENGNCTKYEGLWGLFISIFLYFAIHVIICFIEENRKNIDIKEIYASQVNKLKYKISHKGKKIKYKNLKPENLIYQVLEEYDKSKPIKLTKLELKKQRINFILNNEKF